MGPLVSYRDLELRRNFGFFSGITMMFLDIKEGLMPKYRKAKDGFNRDNASQPKQRYNWESPLENLEMVVRIPSRT